MGNRLRKDALQAGIAKQSTGQTGLACLTEQSAGHLRRRPRQRERNPDSP